MASIITETQHNQVKIEVLIYFSQNQVISQNRQICTGMGQAENHQVEEQANDQAGRDQRLES